MKKLTGTEDMMLKLGAGYSLFYIQTNEMIKTVAEIATAFDSQSKFTIQIWDFEKDPDPNTVLDLLQNTPKNTVIIAKNWNWFLADQFEGENKTFLSFLQNNVEAFSSTEYRKALMIVSDQDYDKAIPTTLQRDFIQVEFELPNAEEIEEIFNDFIEGLKDNPKFQMPSPADAKAIKDELKGLTRREIVNALAYTVKAGKGTIDLKILSTIKAQTVEKAAGLKIGNFNVTFDDIQGYENIKEYAKMTVNSPLAKGILLLGSPGTGKTMISQALSNEVKKKMLILELAELFGSLVGQSEQMMKAALDIVKANAPCILFIDEIEKGLAGVGKSQEGDGGTTKRSMAQFLKFLSDDRPEGIYVVATCNDIQGLPPEWVRSERFDAIFFIDLPNENEREQILNHYKKVYGVAGEAPDMTGWSGAEIKTLCRQAKMLGKDIGYASRFVIPVSKTMGAQIDNLRKWAEGRTIPASTPIKNGGQATTRDIEI